MYVGIIVKPRKIGMFCDSLYAESLRVVFLVYIVLGKHISFRCWAVICGAIG